MVLNGQQPDIIQTIRLRSEGSQQVVAALDETRQRVVSIDTAATELTESFAGILRQRALSTLAQDAAAGRIEFQQLAQAAADLGASKAEIDGLAASVGRLAEQAEQAKQIQSSGGFGAQQVQGIVGQAGGLLSTVGAGSAGSAIASVAGLTATLGPLGIAAGLGTAALSAATDAEKKRAEAAQKTADRLNQIATAGAGGATSESIQKQIDQERARKESLEQTQSTLQSYIDQNNDLLDQYRTGKLNIVQFGDAVKSLFDQANALAGGELGSLSDLDSVLEKNQSSIDDANSNLALYNAQLSSQAVAENNAAQRRAEAGERLIAATEAALAADNMTADQRKAHVDELQREIDSYQALLDTGRLTSDQQRDLIDKIRGLNNEQREYEAVVESTADKLQAQAEALQSVNDAISYTANLYGQIRSATISNVTDQISGLQDERAAIDASLPQLVALSRTSTDAAKSLEQAYTRLDQITDSYTDLTTIVLPQAEARARQQLAVDTQKIVAEQNAKIADIETSAGEKRVEIEAEAADKRVEIVDDSKDRIAKIERDAGRSEADAVASREALSYRQAATRRADAIDDEAKSQAKQLDQLDKSLDKQERALDQSTRQQVAATISNAEQQIAAKRQQYAQEQSDLVAVLNYQNSAYNQMADLAYQGGANMVRSFQNGLLSVGGVVTAPGAYTPLPAPIPGGGTQGAYQAGQQGARDLLTNYFRQIQVLEG